MNIRALKLLFLLCLVCFVLQCARYEQSAATVANANANKTLLPPTASLNQNSNANKSGDTGAYDRLNLGEERITEPLAALPPALTNDDIPANGDTIENFAPLGWYLQADSEGDVNGDKLPDAAAIFSKNPVDKRITQWTEDELLTPKLLVVALRDQTGQLRRAATSQKAVLCQACGGVGGDPRSGVKIENNAVILYQSRSAGIHTDFLQTIRLINDEWYVTNGEAAYLDKVLAKLPEYANDKKKMSSISDQKRDAKRIKLSEFEITKAIKQLDRQSKLLTKYIQESQNQKIVF